MSKKILEKRDSTLDVIRCTALLFVHSVHFFLNTGYYDEPIQGPLMYAMTLMGVFFRACVPLFIMLTGYLMFKKRQTKKYYYGIIRILVIYLLASIACLVCRNLFFAEKISIPESILLILNFTASRYAWYVKMYIGLFFLIPYLNTLYHALHTEQKKGRLIFSLIFLVSVPPTVNAFFMIYLNENVLPNWWILIYPVLYYYLGAFLHDYHDTGRTFVNLAFLLFSVFSWGSSIYFTNFGENYYNGIWTDYNPLPVVILSVMIFMLLRKLPVNHLPDFMRSILAHISNLCFGAYLLSAIFDSLFYEYLNNKVPVMTDKLPYFFRIVPAVYICSLLSSAVIQTVYHLLHKLYTIFSKLGQLRKKRLRRNEVQNEK